MSSSPRAPTTAEETGLESGSEQSSELISISRIARSAELPCVDLTAFDGSVFNLARHFKPSQIVASCSLPAIPARFGEAPVALVIASPQDQDRVRDAFRGKGVECPKFLLATRQSFAMTQDQVQSGEMPVMSEDAEELGLGQIRSSMENAPRAGRQEGTLPQSKAAEFGQLEVQSSVESSNSASDAPAVRLVNRIIGKAIARKASDIHFEPYEDAFRVRMRVDGVLTVAETPDPEISQAVAARLKVMARMDISERRLPQDGRIRLNMSDGRQADLRVNSLPTLWGEKLVLRILGGSSEARAISELGMSEAQSRLFESALQQSQGLILVTGPTGSGKTVSLYAGLGFLNSNERNILAVEDPVEITLPGINQVQVNSRVGLTFSRALRAFLRQDPDIIMLGEIRDQETAEIAVRAAQTGHVVLATLHTNSALETPGRLIDMGVPPYLLGSALSLVVAQRLVRELCPRCSDSQVMHDALPSAGCDHCVGGYSGRRGIYEVVQVTPELAQAIARQEHLDELARIAEVQGWTSLREEGEKLLRRGVTSRGELDRVCS